MSCFLCWQKTSGHANADGGDLPGLWHPVSQAGADLGKQADRVFAPAEKTLINMDRKYLYCFLAGLGAEQIGGLFNIETDSVYTVRYRLRRKFPKNGLPV